MKKGLEIKRIFTEPGKSAFDYFEYERRDAVILSGETVIFEQKGIEVPKQWSQHATNILAQKYFRKTGIPQLDGTLGGETSIRQTVHRLADCWRAWGEKLGYFDKKNGQAFYDEIVYMLLGQYAAPNSPQWFNTGLHNSYGIEGGEGQNWYCDGTPMEYIDGLEPKGYDKNKTYYFAWKVKSAYPRPQTSACFILSVKDDLTGPGGIFDGVVNEAKVFKGGSGAGTNFSDVRAKGEPLSNGGTSSGVKSFLNIYNAAAGAVKSGGTTRRAAKMVILDTDHPEILDFINWKMNEEKKAKILIAAGYSDGYEDEAYSTVSGQNSNNSVSASDAFMVAVANDGAWNTTNRTDGKVHTTYQAREISSAITDCTWASGDPGLQFIDTINKWNTCKADGKIKASNPCVTGDTLISTDLGDFPIADLVGKTINVYGGDANLHTVTQVFETGEKEVYELALYGSRKLKLTADHRVLTRNRGDVPANELKNGDAVYILNKDFQGRGYLAVGFFKSLTFLGVEKVYDLTEPNTNHFFANGIAVHNCSEYFFLDDTACNLASLKLTNFLEPSGAFDDDLFAACARIWTIVLDITVSMSSYPTENTALGAYNYRTLGLGYGNLGALLMLRGIVYGSKEALKLTKHITQKMHAVAYETSAEIAEILGPFPRWEANRESMNEVLALHGLDYLKDKPMRNAQVTLLAPTGTIGFIMDFDTTGIEPHYQLTTTKHLAGGGKMSIESRAVRPALKNLGYSEAEIEQIAKYIAGHKAFPSDAELRYRGIALENKDKASVLIANCFSFENILEKLNPDVENIANKLGFTQAQIDYLNAFIYGHGTIEGAPYLKSQHLPIFDCANVSGKGTRFIPAIAHLEMMAAAQPYLSGGISKTVNLPFDATKEQVWEIYETAWRLGIKSVAIYRDGSKWSQPYQSQTRELQAPGELIKETAQGALAWGERRHFERERDGKTRTFKIGGVTVHFTINVYANGSPCELFIEVIGSDTFVAMVNMIARKASRSLQYGVPLKEIIEDLRHYDFPPHGFTDDPAIKSANSIFDYIGQVLELYYLGEKVKPELFIPEELARPDGAESNALNRRVIACMQENGGGRTCEVVPNGKCLICLTCGQTTGCS